MRYINVQCTRKKQEERLIILRYFNKKDLLYPKSLKMRARAKQLKPLSIDELCDGVELRSPTLTQPQRRGEHQDQTF